MTGRLVTLRLGKSDSDEENLNGASDDAFFIRTEDQRSVTVTAWLAEDGALVVQIDTDWEAGDDRLRVNVNEAPVFDRGVESGINYEEN